MVWGAIATVGSAIMGGIGASKKQDAANKQTEINYKAAKEGWEYENEMADRDYEWRLEQNETTRRNNLRDAKYQDQSALNNWKMQIAEQDFNFGTQLLAKHKSNQTLAAQIGLNDQALNSALRQQDRWITERALERDFSLEDQSLIMTRATDDMSAAFNEILFNRQKEAIGIESKYAGTQIRRNAEAGAIAFNDQENIVEGLMGAGKAQNMQAGRSTDKAIQSQQAKTGRQTAAFEEQASNIFKLAAVSMHELETDLFMVNANAERLRKKVGQDYINKAKQSSLDREKIWASWDSAKIEKAFQREEVHKQHSQAYITAFDKNLPMPMMGPKPPPPFATPIPEILDPNPHVWSPEPRKGATQSGAVWSSIGSALPGVVDSFQSAFKPADKPSS